jgi:hypothetical protein
MSWPLPSSISSFGPIAGRPHDHVGWCPFAELEFRTQKDDERLFGREGDAVRLPGVPPDLGDLVFLSSFLELVPTVATGGLVVGHVAVDTESDRLEGGKRAARLRQKERK